MSLYFKEVVAKYSILNNYIILSSKNKYRFRLSINLL